MRLKVVFVFAASWLCAVVSIDSGTLSWQVAAMSGRTAILLFAFIAAFFSGGDAGLRAVAPGRTVEKSDFDSSSDVFPAPVSDAKPLAHYTYEIVNVFPHDRGAFTQGLVFYNGGFLESTGLNGQSSLREVELKTGKVLRKKDINAEYFAEGLAVAGDKAYQLTWKAGKAFVYDIKTFHQESELSYDGEGWGLTTDGHLLILSDGTSRLRFLDPSTFKLKHTIVARMQGQPMSNLNELEWVKGEIYANIWQTDFIASIDPKTGNATAMIDFTGLLPLADRDANTDVLNGIAYDERGDRLFVTGKCWPKVFEVRLKAE
jgi:glutaminyl-peptide cyclotransferase